MVGYNILPIGFSSYEKSTIETFFRLAGRRAPHWGLTARSSEARVILFNATSLQDIDAFRSLVASWQKVIIVGDSDFGTGWAVLPRPIKLTAILGMLDGIAKESEPNAEVAAPVIDVLDTQPSSTDVNPWVNPSADNCEDGHGFGRTVDTRPPVLPEQEQNCRDQRTGVTDTDPEHKVHDRPGPEDRVHVPPDPDPSQDEVTDTSQEHGSG